MTNPEKEFAINLANKVLETASLDPDADLSVLARQFLRSLEAEAQVSDKILQQAINAIDKKSQDYGSEYGSYDHTCNAWSFPEHVEIALETYDDVLEILRGLKSHKPEDAK